MVTGFSNVEMSLEVEGNPEGADEWTYQFIVNLTCIHPDTGGTYYPSAGEVRVRVVRVRALLPDVIASERNNIDQRVVLGTEKVTEYTEYKLEAYHYQSGDEAVKRVACYPDGRWSEIPNY